MNWTSAASPRGHIWNEEKLHQTTVPEYEKELVTLDLADVWQAETKNNKHSKLTDTVRIADCEDGQMRVFMGMSMTK